MNDKRDWILYGVLFGMVAVIGMLLFGMLLIPEMRSQPALFFLYLFTGLYLGVRWLLAISVGLLVMVLVCDSSNRLVGGVRRIPNGAYGNAHFASSEERRQMYPIYRYRTAKKPGITLSYTRRGAEVDTSDRTVLLVSPPGGGKTTCLLIPTLLYNAIVNRNTNGNGASMLSIDCKGEEYQKTATFMREHGYHVKLLDFRNPLAGLQVNMLDPINRNMDIALRSVNPAERLEARSNAERHAKILADAICAATDIGHNTENTFFVETAKGLITAIVLVVSEFGEPSERHIVSVFRLIVELNGLLQEENDKNNTLQKSRLGKLLDMLPGDIRAKLYAGAATSADVRTSMNVFSSALSKLLAFLDAKLEQMICAQSSGLTAAEFIEKPTCIYLVLPDEDNTAHFFATLYIQQISSQLIEIASNRIGQRLPRQVLVLWDEFGQAPPCKGMESWITAWRSRGIRLLLALQTEAQLEDRYGRSRAEVIRQAIQIRMYSNLGAGDTAQKLSKELGNYTVATQSVTNNNRNGSSSQSMTARPLLSHDEIGALPLGTWLVLVNGHHPVRAKLKCYDRIWRNIQPMLHTGERRAVTRVPYLTEEKLYARYKKDPLVGVLDEPIPSQNANEEKKSSTFRNKK